MAQAQTVTRARRCSMSLYHFYYVCDGRKVAKGEGLIYPDDASAIEAANSCAKDSGFHIEVWKRQRRIATVLKTSSSPK